MPDLGVISGLFLFTLNPLFQSPVTLFKKCTAQKSNAVRLNEQN